MTSGPSKSRALSPRSGRYALCRAPVLAAAASAAIALPGCDHPDPAIARGKRDFARACAACHAQNASGLAGLGANLRTSEFVGSSTDDELVAMIKQGKDATATHPAMPAKGGIPTLTDDDLRDIVAYIRSLRHD